MSFWLLRVSRGVLGGNTIEHNDSVSQVGRHDEVVLHHKCSLLCVEDVPANTKKALESGTVGSRMGGRKVTDEGGCKEKGRMKRQISLYRRKAEEPLNDPGSHQSLLRVQVGRRLIDQVNVSWFPQTQSESDSLQLTTRQVLYLRGEKGRKQGGGASVSVWKVSELR